jgi:hypothetical protein
MKSFSITAAFFFLIILISCEKKKEDLKIDELPCEFIDHKYYNGEADPLGTFSGDYILIGSDTINSDISIRALISSKNYIDKDYEYEIHRAIDYGYKYACIKLSRTCNCNEVTWVINDLEKDFKIAFAHYTIQTDDCTNFIWEPIGEQCVDSYSNIFYVRVKNPNDLGDLDNIILQTNTQIIEQNQFMSNWFSLSADKNSKGDALEMANFFFSTGLFDSSEPDIIKVAVE